MAKRKKKKEINWSEIEMFQQQAVKFQKASRCECPTKSRLNAIIARKYLFYVIDEIATQ